MSAPATLVIRDTEVEGRRVDVHVERGLVSAVVPSVERTPRPPRAEVVEAAGGALLPGLHDHHLHLAALAAARRSHALGSTLEELRTLPTDPGVTSPWLRVTGYHESDHGPIDRRRLDDLVPTRPVRVQHQTGMLWILNSAALHEIGLPEHPDGLLYERDADLRERIPPEPLDLAGAAHALAAFGVTGMTDATPTERRDDVELLLRAARDGSIPQRLAVTAGPGLAAEVPRLTAGTSVRPGPVKIVVSDVTLPSIESLVEAMLAARRTQRAVAVHAVSRVALALALAAWDEVGARPGDRVEHGGVVPPDLAANLAKAGLIVVTQPSFVRDRGDRFLREVDDDDREHLYPCGRLIREGVRVAGSTDAPFGDADPWAAVAAATDRLTREGRVLGQEDRIDPTRALELFLGELDDPGGRPRRVAAGTPADLCLLHLPLADALRRPSSESVRTVVCDGAVVVDGAVT